MNKGSIYLSVAVPLLLVVSIITYAQDNQAIDSEAIIQKILAVEALQREELKQIIFDAEYVEGEGDGEGGFVEKVRFEKSVTLKYLSDTVLFEEEYLRYFKEGEQRSDEECQQEATERLEKKKDRGSRDISYPMLSPFYPENRTLYNVNYRGVYDSSVGNYLCHHFSVESKTPDESTINGDYYFDADSFQLVRVDFSPAKMGGNLLFKMESLKMSMSYAPTSEGVWLPNQFDIVGKGKAAFFIGVNWSGTEYFRNPQVNPEISEDVFPVDND